MRISTTIAADTTVRIEFVAEDGSTSVLKDGLALLEGEVIDAAAMSAAKLDAFLVEQVADAKAQDVLCWCTSRPP